MKLFVMILLYSLPTLGYDCTEVDIQNHPTPDITNLCTNLYVSNPVTKGHDPNPLIINVTDEVIISANITIDGAQGLHINGIPTVGGDGGPGAGNGGGWDSFNPPYPGQDADFPYPVGTSNGDAENNTHPTCGNGGGGGGFGTAGAQGAQCTGGSPLVADGGTIVPPTQFTFTVLDFRGGFGGGSGDLTANAEAGSGGGGGGGLHINAGGDINIASGVTISARGGNGGNALIDGGGGGGGSGGAIWLKTAGAIHNSGIIDLRGGSGGINLITLGHGGAGGDGSYLLESSAAPISGTGLRLPTIPPPVGTAHSPKLNSSISCGALKQKSVNQTYQIFLGFTLAAILATLIKILSPSRLKT